MGCSYTHITKELTMLSKDPLVVWCLYLGAGILLTLVISFLPKRLKLGLGRFLPPNWASVVHVPIGWIGYFACYLNGYFLLANLVMGISGGLDKYDGMEARAFDQLVGTPLKSRRFWDQMSHRGTTPLGKVLDPGMDKLTHVPIYAHIAWVMFLAALLPTAAQVSYLLYLAVGLIALMICADIFGQVIRMERFRHWHAREDKSATHVGKIKSAAQWVWLGFFVPWHQNWIAGQEVYLAVLDFILAIMLALAAVSAFSKIRPLREIWANG